MGHPGRFQTSPQTQSSIYAWQSWEAEPLRVVRAAVGGWKLVAPEAEPVEDDASVRPPDKSPPAEEMGGVTGG